MKFKVAIPSYNRSRYISEYTLNTLLNKNIPPESIDIFVANDDEFHEYKKNISEDKYNELIVGVKGKANQINFIRQFYPKGMNLLNCDDDIIKIQYCKENKLRDLKDLSKYSKFIFKLMHKYKSGICGTYFPRNAFFMSNQIDFNYYNVEGGMYWTVNNPTSKLNIFEKACEDLEFSVKNYLYYGKIMRTKEVCYTDASRFRNNDNHLERLAGDINEFPIRKKYIELYPHLLKWNSNNKNPYYIKSIKQKKHFSLKFKERDL